MKWLLAQVSLIISLFKMALALNSMNVSSLAVTEWEVPPNQHKSATWLYSEQLPNCLYSHCDQAVKPLGIGADQPPAPSTGAEYV